MVTTQRQIRFPVVGELNQLGRDHPVSTNQLIQSWQVGPAIRRTMCGAETVYKVASQKSIPARICQPNLYFINEKG